MMRPCLALVRFLVAAGCTLLMLAANAGSKGYTVVFFDIGDQQFFNSALYDAYTNGFRRLGKGERCWESSATGGKAFELIIKKKLPDGMTQELARAIWAGDASAAKSAQLAMKKAGRSYRGNSIDGLFVLDAREGAISIMSLGARAKLGSSNPSRKITIRWDDVDPKAGAAEFDYALCSIAKPVGVGFSP